MDRNTLLDLIPAYTLGALDAAEREAVETLLETDAEAQALLAEYQEVSDLLVLMTPLEPAPAHLKDDLRRRLADQEPAYGPGQRSKSRHLMLWRMAAVAALLAVAAGLTVLMQTLQSDLRDPAQLYAQLAAQTDAVWVDVVPNPEEPFVFEGQLVTAPGSTDAVIRINGLPTLPADQTYQLWLAEPETVINGGLFQSEGPDQPTYLLVPLSQPISYYRGLGVSLEPAGGSPFPNRSSGPNVFRVPLST